MADKNVTINNILPGKMDTDRLRGGHKLRASQTGRDMDAVVAEDAKSVPARRFGTAEEFGSVCAFLCSVHAGYIVGQNILVDGGFFAKAF